MDTTPIVKKEETQLKTEFMKNWRSFQKYDESPLETYFRELDILYRSSLDSEYFERAMQEPIAYNNKLIISDLKFRADSRMNVVMSISDIIEKTGTGKSSAGLKLCGTVATIFSSKFDLSHVVWMPEELDKKIETAENNTVWQLDEQKRKGSQIGTMSSAIDARLGDMEDMLRQSGISIIYVAPQIRSHNHFYVLNTWRLMRVRNPVCQNCNKNCQECAMPFNERSGYPDSVILLLQTKRLTTGMQVPRGLIKVSMPDPTLMQEYWKMKEINVQRMKKKEESLWRELKAIAIKVFELKKDSLVHRKQKGGWAVTNKLQITIALYDVVGMRYLTNDARMLVEEQIRMMLDNYASEKAANEGFEDGNKDLERKENEE